MAIDKNSVGLASELLVASKLIQHGCQISLTLGHTKSVDIHASKNGKNHSIQVKGAQKNKGNGNLCSWRIEKSSINKNRIYIFVNLNLISNNNNEDVYIITGADLIPLLKGKLPPEYIYSTTLSQYLSNWKII